MSDHGVEKRSMHTTRLSRLRHSDALDKAAAAALYFFAFTALLSTAAATVALWILVTLYLVKAPSNGFHRARWLFLPWASLLGYMVCRTAVAAWQRPEWAAYHADGFWGWARLLLFPVVAWWCRGDELVCRRLLGVALAGLVLGMLRAMDLQTLESAYQGMRTGFHLRIVAFGLYAGTFLWAVVCFAPSFFQAHRFRWLWIALWAALLLALGQSLFFTQSRGVFLALGATALMLTAVMFLTKTADASQRPPKSLKRSILIFWVFLAIITVVNWPLLEKRWKEEKDTFLQLHSFDFSQPAHDSTGYRAHLYRFAWEGIRARPLWGGGPAISKRFIQESGRETLKAPNWKGEMQWWDHLHSTHLEVLFHYGIVGGLLWLWMYGSLFLGVRRTWKQGGLSTPLGLFSSAALIYLFLWALFDFRSLHPDWRFFWNFLAGVIAAKPLWMHLYDDGKESGP
ncbi:O-antigen ligase family protein [Desulfosoma sp.]|uniref:O-antigen ligase family protein n=1 Tax=Desulfosoma sp. TaxID=2603217 RepID=UPI00404B5C0F